MRVILEETDIEITELWVKQIPLCNVGEPNQLKTYLEEKIDLPWRKRELSRKLLDSNLTPDSPA